MMIKRSLLDKTFDFINIVFLSLCAVACIYPFWHVLVKSLLPYQEIMKSDFYFFPYKVTLEPYLYILHSDKLLNGLIISIAVTLTGTIYQLMITAMTAYGLSKKNLPGRNIIFIFIIITMFFSGGLIPYYLLIKKLGLIDNILVLVIPAAISTFNMIVMKNFFASLPAEMEESAKVDGYGYFCIFVYIILPLSKPVVATISLFIAVAHWNNWFTPMLFINTQEKWPLQLILRDILIQNNIDFLRRAVITSTNKDFLLKENIKMAIVIVSVTPIIIIYPFIQKYFVKGVMIGAIKS